MGVTGITVGITGESAVNPQIPDICLPFTMSHEMAHRMCVSTEWDANFAAFLAGHVNESVEYQYSAYFMAYRYCYMSLLNSNDASASAAAARVNNGISDELYQDLTYYNSFFSGSAAPGTASTAAASEENVSKIIKEILTRTVRLLHFLIVLVEGEHQIDILAVRVRLELGRKIIPVQRAEILIGIFSGQKDPEAGGRHDQGEARRDQRESAPEQVL
jgi:hypothetical protein